MIDRVPIDVLGCVQGYCDAPSLFVLWSMGIECIVSAVSVEFLIEATRRGAVILMQKILEGVPGLVDALDPVQGITPLIISAYLGHCDATRMLLRHGAGVNMRSACGDTALGVASYRGHPDMVILLMENGADVDAHNDIGQTPLIRACCGGHGGIVDMLLLRGADPNATTATHRETALMLAAQIGHVGIIGMLLRRGAVVDARNMFGHTPLMMAVYHGDVEAVRVLVDHGADVHARDYEGNTPMILSSLFCKHTVLEFFQGFV